MVAAACPAVLVSAPASGQGKTTVTAALARAWRKQGYTVQAFKCGPDFIDGMILEQATGRPVYNLDLGMCGEADARQLLHEAAQHADVLIIEGVMGLYDGKPSSADIAETLGLPVAIVIDANAMAQTFGAVAEGLMRHRTTLHPIGAIANRVGSEGHAQLLRQCLPNDIPWLGAVPSDDALSMPERHLGLLLAEEMTDLEERLERAAEHLLASCQIPLPPQVSFPAIEKQPLPPLLAGKRIAIARDPAFCFIYEANLDCLKAMGAELTFFSPLRDAALPEADAYWLPGGYPELHLAALGRNSSMRAALQEAAQRQKPILAECGGMMALSESINGEPTFGLLPGHSRIEKKLQGLGTQSLRSTLSSKPIQAHTFHHGLFETDIPPALVGKSVYGTGEHVYKHGSITATFLHFYFPSNPTVAAHFFLP